VLAFAPVEEGPSADRGRETSAYARHAEPRRQATTLREHRDLAAASRAHRVEPRRPRDRGEVEHPRRVVAERAELEISRRVRGVWHVRSLAVPF
jgi:hypothetical protein